MLFLLMSVPMCLEDISQRYVFFLMALPVQLLEACHPAWPKRVLSWSSVEFGCIFDFVIQEEVLLTHVMDVGHWEHSLL